MQDLGDRPGPFSESLLGEHDVSPTVLLYLGARGPVSSPFEQIYVHANTYSMCTVCIRIRIYI